jgi:CBS domain-containing protein
MTTVAEVMTRDVQTLAPDDTIRAAAQKMDELNVGVLPVCDGTKLVGMLTDRDIVVRAVSAGVGAGQPIGDIVSAPVDWCYDSEDVSVVQHKMADRQIRRLPVVNADKRLVGIVSLGDVATNADGELSSTLGAVSSPSHPDR